MITTSNCSMAGFYTHGRQYLETWPSLKAAALSGADFMMSSEDK